MKQFSLEEYLKNPSRKVVTRDGRDVRIICTDKVGGLCPIVALVRTTGGEAIHGYNINGESYNSDNSVLDLFFVSKKHEGWVNVYKDDKSYNVGNLFSSKEDALAVTKGYNVYVATIKIEWEE